MNAAETQARWGLPDWTRPDMYPDAAETSNSIWRWEFLRRQPNYRRQFSISAEWHTPSKLINEPAQPILTYVGGAMMPDPRHPLDANLALVILEAFNATHGFIVPREGSRRLPAHYTGDGLVDYRFSLAEPLGPQLKKATEELEAAQAENSRQEEYRASKPRTLADIPTDSGRERVWSKLANHWENALA